MKNLTLLLAALALTGIMNKSIAQLSQDLQYHGSHDHSSGDGTKLHINSRWSECSFQLDPSLTQGAWREFTKEAGLVVFFRPLIDAKPLGARNYEFSILQWQTKFDDRKDAWNDTFVHPDSVHWLKESSRLAFPGLTFRAGITDKLDIGLYLTKSPGANYGFYGAQVQYNLIHNSAKKISASARAGFNSMYGPKDMGFTVYGLEVVTSKEFVLSEKWLTIAPYVGVSSYLACSYEKSDVVDLENEQVVGVQATAGVLAKVKFARLAFEYSPAAVNTVAMKIGAAF